MWNAMAQTRRRKSMARKSEPDAHGTKLGNMEKHRKSRQVSGAAMRVTEKVIRPAIIG